MSRSAFPAPEAADLRDAIARGRNVGDEAGASGAVHDRPLRRMTSNFGTVMGCRRAADAPTILRGGDARRLRLNTPGKSSVHSPAPSIGRINPVDDLGHDRHSSR